MKSEKQKQLKQIIDKEVLVIRGDGIWIFDFRAIVLRPERLTFLAKLFWETYEHTYPFQVGGRETAAIPLITAIVLEGYRRGTPINGFYIRKERKTGDMQKHVEGVIDTNTKTILVDDLINKGGTFESQIQILENAGASVSDIFVFVRFRDLNEYPFAQEKNIKITAPFTLADFPVSLKPQEQETSLERFLVKWKFESSDPNYYYVLPKSGPAIDDARVYFGADNGTFWALNQHDGSIAWQFTIWRNSKGKAIFSTPAVSHTAVYFGAYDGSFYALEKETGKKKWVFRDADWIGSSPALAPNLQSVFIGLEFGLLNKQGGIAALDIRTGKKKWEYRMPRHTHATPACSEKQHVVGVGSNDGIFYLFDADTGVLKWMYRTGDDIKASAVFDDKRKRVSFGSFDGNIYTIDVKTGKKIHAFETEGEVYSTPYIHKNKMYITSTDKRLYCLNLDTFEEEWRFETNGKIFSNPTVIHDHIYFGSNDGFLYELNMDGEETGYFPAGERVVNTPAYNEETERFFLGTHANEMYCLEKESAGGMEKRA